MADSATDKILDCPAPDASSASSSTLGESTCHVLPCNVDFEGMAKTHMFFRPTQIEDGVLASSFRGRGLLAKQEKEGTDTDEVRNENHALLLSLGDNQIQVKVSISNFVEWHHEHSIKSLKYKEKESSRIQAANEWIEISNSLHDPLPIEE